ncbi:MAG: tRNA (guanosine(46)-N7)-methyltransferase TrmB [Candidatus Midichloria sp.]|nr:tRNA (guanosine(46)-N7)-methyltransferase TrmB [Candidatus Midichloria sp.]
MCAKGILYTDKPRYLPSFIRRNRLKGTARKELISSDLVAFSLNPQNVKKYISLDNELKLEIGFGDGSHMIKRALSEPKTLFVGCEVYLNGIANVLKAIKQYNIKNIVLFNGDARDLLKQVPSNIFTTIYVLFPDPWPKKKHHKRRLVSLEFLNLLRDKLKAVSSTILIATDHRDYALYLQRLIENSGIKSVIGKPDDWVETKYQMKSLALGLDFKCFAIYK